MLTADWILTWTHPDGVFGDPTGIRFRVTNQGRVSAAYRDTRGDVWVQSDLISNHVEAQWRR